MTFSKYINKNVISSIVLCVVATTLYMLLAWFMSHHFDVVASNFITDGIVCVLLGALYVFHHWGKPKKPKENRVRFSAFGWLVILAIFAAVYVSSESVGNFLAMKYPIGLTEDYANLKGADLYGYILMAATIGPIAEELLFRYLMFWAMRKANVNFWVAYIISTVFFTLIHGTVMHIPVTVMLSLFLCIFYEVTNSFLLCVLFHMLFNYFGATLLFTIPNSPYIMLGVYAVIFLLLVLSYVYRDKVFHKYLKKGTLEQFENYLNHKVQDYDTPDDTLDSDTED